MLGPAAKYFYFIFTGRQHSSPRRKSLNILRILCTTCLAPWRYSQCVPSCLSAGPTTTTTAHMPISNVFIEHCRCGWEAYRERAFFFDASILSSSSALHKVGSIIIRFCVAQAPLSSSASHRLHCHHLRCTRSAPLSLSSSTLQSHPWRVCCRNEEVKEDPPRCSQIDGVLTSLFCSCSQWVKRFASSHRVLTSYAIIRQI